MGSKKKTGKKIRIIKKIKTKSNIWQEKWITLEKDLELEVKLINKALKNAIKECCYIDCANLEKDLYVIKWVLNQMKSIKETGKVL